MKIDLDGEIIKGSDLETMLEIYQRAHAGRCSVKKEDNGNSVYLIVDGLEYYGDGILTLVFTPKEHAYVAFRTSQE